MKDNSIELKAITLHRVRMQLNEPFTTSFGTLSFKDFIVVEIEDGEGVIGWGESVAFNSPWYNEETVETNHHILKDYLIPLLLERPFKHPSEVNERFNRIRRNNMAKASIEGAVWDLYAKKIGLPLYRVIGGTKNCIEVGISLGIEKNISDLIKKIDTYVTEGYKRIKIKIKPGWDVDVLQEVRKVFPTLAIMADANSAYSLDDINHLKKLDQYRLTMIEQPLAHDDIVDHATLQKEMVTPICLDESIHSISDARKAIELGSCKIINIKIGRVGGITEAIKIHDYCKEKNISVWCGGMLESGIGRAHNIAITSLSQFNLPGDTAASSRYWKSDIIEPEVVVKNGEIKLVEEKGIGFEVNRKLLDLYTVTRDKYKR